MRRLAVLSFKRPENDQHIGKMAELLINTEASGILNWLLEGRAKLFKDKLQLIQTQEQKQRAVNLLISSESPKVFVRCCLAKRKDVELGMGDLYSCYQKWCKDKGIRLFKYHAFSQQAREQVELSHGLRYRHDLVGENGRGFRRGWKGLQLVDEDAKIQSSKSDNINVALE